MSINVEFLPKNIELSLFNTFTRKKEIFHPLANNHVRMYTCGPTVYDFAHIGNFRTYVFEDLLRRTLKFLGMQVTQVMNITDIDDKTIKGSIAKNLSLDKYTEPYKNAFFTDLQSLGIERAEYYPCATDYIPQMIDFIQVLLNKNIAYKSRDHSIYFSIDKLPSYGALSHLKLSELKVGAGEILNASDEYDKENMGDFVLWKAYDPKRDGNIYWPSPFGPGRPGWHLECSTMAMQLLGETIDIHAGAVDNIFPHHENEIAQSESLSGKQFVKLWIHSEHLVVNHKKMSKSLGNFYTLRDLLNRGYAGPQIRYMLLHTHYRTQLNFTFEGLDAAKISLQRLTDFGLRMKQLADQKKEPTAQTKAILHKAGSDFTYALADDLNISCALAAVFEMMKEINILYDEQKLTGGCAKETFFLLEQFNQPLGIFFFETEEKFSNQILSYIEQRAKARKEKNWKLSDEIRKDIHALGYEVEDTPEGQRLKKIQQ